MFSLLLLCPSTLSPSSSSLILLEGDSVSNYKKFIFQGGVGIRRSLDELAAKYLRYDLKEPPRLVSTKLFHVVLPYDYYAH